MNGTPVFDASLRSDLALKALASQPLGIAIIGRDYRVQFWNDWMAQWSGLSSSQMMGRPLDSLFPDLAGSEMSSAIADVLLDGSNICWSQTVDPERLDRIERAMTRGDRELPLHRMQLSAIELDGASYCLLQIDEAPYDPVALSDRKQRAPDCSRGMYPAYIETDWLAVLTLDALGYIQDLNAVAENLFGYSRDQLLDAPVRLLFPEFENLPEGDLKNHIESLVREQPGGLIEAATADGVSLHMEMQVFRSVGNSGSFVLCCSDSSALSSAEETLFRQRELFSAVYEQVADGIMLADDQGLIEHINPVGLKLLQVTEASVVGKLAQEILTFASADGDRLPCIANEALTRGTAVTLPESAQLVLDGSDPVPTMATATPLRNRENELAGVVIVFRAASEARRVSSRLAWQSLHDPLTQLANRRHLESELVRAIEDAHANNKTHTLLYIDLYNFSVINDTCGHTAGDELLRQFARLLSRQVGADDLVARLGNDEFAVLVKNRPVEESRALADELLWQIKAFSFPWGERRLKIGASIGAKVIDNKTESEIDVLVGAGSSCAMAREAGRNRVHFEYRSKEVAQRQNLAEWIPRITEALEEDRFILYCQPIVPAAKTTMSDSDTRHYELLVRMVDRDGKLIAPGKFIPAAEYYGLIDDLDRWTLKKVIKFLSDNQQRKGSRQLRFSVNLSGHTVGDEAFKEYVLRKFRETGIDPRQLQFEITETAAVRNFDRAMDLIHALKAKGCYFSLDDFGSGLSSFAYLKQLPVDFLKIDGSFVRNMELNDIDYSMISTINHLGHIMGIRTVAECVENDTQLAMLREIGLDYIQGYAVAKPKPLHELSCGVVEE